MKGSRIALRYERIQERIRSACERASRSPSDVQLIAVTKRQSVADIEELYACGARQFGESRVQELLEKKDRLPDDIHWHFIGHLQSNKAKYLAPFIECVHSIDSIECANELSYRAGNRPIHILTEINISGEEQKHGVKPAEAEALVTQLTEGCPNLILSGLMGMASFEEDPERTRPQFIALRELRDRIAERHPQLQTFRELSMGMTNDFEVAIECGATMVRIGSALFSSE